MTRKTAIALLVTVSLIWGAASPVIKFTLNFFPPFVFLLYRFALSAIIALIFLSNPKHKNNLKIPFKLVPLLLTTGFLSFTAALNLLFVGIDKTHALTASVIMTSSPILVVFMGYKFLNETITRNEKIGISMAIIGTLIAVILPTNGISSNTTNILAASGNLLVLMAVLADSVGTILSRFLVTRHNNPMVITQILFLIAFIIQIPFTLIFHPPSEIISYIISAPLAAHLGVIYMALFSGTIAYLLRNIALSYIEASESAVFNYLQPLWAAPLAIFWLKDYVTWQIIPGGLLIASGIIISELSRKTRRKTKNNR